MEVWFDITMHQVVSFSLILMVLNAANDHSQGTPRSPDKPPIEQQRRAKLHLLQPALSINGILERIFRGTRSVAMALKAQKVV